MSESDSLSPSAAPNISVIRGDDLEARELHFLEWMGQRAMIRPHIAGGRSDNIYGRGETSMMPTRTWSLAGYAQRLPLGATGVARAEAAFPSINLRRVHGLEDPVRRCDVVYLRETFHDHSRQAAELALNFGKPIVVTCSENIPFRYEEQRRQRDNKAVVRDAADLFLAKSEGAKDALILEGVEESRIRIIPWAIDTDVFEPGPKSANIRTSWGAADDDLVFLYAGRLLREKGLIELLIGLAPELREQEDLRLIFQGTGPEYSRLEAAAAALGVSRQVRQAPWVPRATMPDVYRSADVVALPSVTTPYWREQFGFNLIEAMACGRPLLASNSGAIPEVVGDAAQMFDEHDTGSLRRALKTLVQSRKRRSALGHSARTRAVRLYSYQAVSALMTGAFYECTKRSK